MYSISDFIDNEELSSIKSPKSLLSGVNLSLLTKPILKGKNNIICNSRLESITENFSKGYSNKQLIQDLNLSKKSKFDLNMNKTEISE